MADRVNRLVNLIVNDVRNENLEQTIAQFDAFENKLRGLATSAVGEELGRSFKGMTEQELEAAGVLDQIIRKEAEMISMARGRSGDKPATSIEEYVEKGALYRSILDKVTESLRAKAEAEQLDTEQEKAAVAAEEERIKQEQKLAEQEADRLALEETLANFQGMTIRKYQELTAEQTRLIFSSAQMGKSEQEIIELMKEEGVSAGQVRQALAELGIQVEKTNSSLGGHSAGMGDAIREQRGFRYGALELLAVTSMVTLAFGEQMPTAVRELDKTFMMMTSAGLAATMLGLGNVATLALVVAAALVGLGIGLMNVDEETQNLGKSLDQLAKKDEVVDALSKVLDISKESAQEMYKLAQGSGEYAAALRDLVENTRDMTGLEKFFRGGVTGLSMLIDRLQASQSGINDNTTAAAQFLNILNAIGGKLYEVFGAPMDALRQNQAAVAEQRLQLLKAQKDSADAQSEMDKETISRQNAINSSVDAGMKAYGNYSDAIEKADRSMADSTDRAYRTMQDSNARAAQSRTDAENNADQARNNSLRNLSFQEQQEREKNNEQLRKIQDTLRDAEAKAWQSYNDKVSDADRTRAEKLADLEYQYGKDTDNANNERLKRAYDLAYKLYQIERERIEALADLDFNTALDVSKAKTENDKDEVMWRAMHEREIINRRAEDSRADAIAKANQEEADSAKKIKNLQDEMQHRKDIINRSYADELADAGRTLKEQLAQAKDNYKDQLDALNFSIQQQAEARAHQVDEIRIAHEQAYAAAKLRYDQETAAAKKRYDEEVADARKANLEATKNAADRYDEEKRAVQTRYDEELKKIQETWDAWLTKHNLTMQGLDAERQMLSDFIGPLQPITQGVPGGAGGLDMIVPPGYNNDTFPIRAASGEHVTITPSQNSGGQTVNIAVEPMLAPMIQSFVSQLVKSQVLKEGVNMIINDATYQG